MSQEYIQNPNPDVNADSQYQPSMQPASPQPPKKDNRVFALLCIILALLVAIITALVVIWVTSKDDKAMNEVKGNKRPTTASTQSVTEEVSDVSETCPFCKSTKITAPDSDGYESCNDCGASWAENGGNNDDSTTEEPTSSGGSSTGTPSGGQQAAASSKPSNGIQTLEYFNTAINKVKTHAKSVEQKEVTNYLADSPTIPSALNGIYKMLGGDSWLDKMLKDNSQGAATLKGGDIKAKFPVEGESYASMLQPADVKAATCTESNGIYTITITTLPDGMGTNHKHGSGHNPKALNVILPETVNANIPGAAKSLVGEAKMAYPSSTITITVDAKTGNVLTASYDLKWTISFTKMAANLPLGTKSVYEIKW